MAFDRKGTDWLYDKAIEPLLENKYGIKPFRVDRSNRNDDVDDQIIAELKKCDFVIADLTYARPSVYFEAGIAQGRPVPVIYICRKDHFRHKQDDTHGNFRVHFDLQMKPIIKWDETNTNAFVKQLNGRIKNIIQPLLKNERQSESESRLIQSFSTLPLFEKLSALRKAYLNSIRQRGFSSDSRTDFEWKHTGRPKSLRWSIFRANNTLSKKDLSHYSWIAESGAQTKGEELFEQGTPPKSIFCDVVLGSIHNVAIPTVAAAFPDFRVYPEAGIIIAEKESSITLKKTSRGRNGLWLGMKEKNNKKKNNKNSQIFPSILHKQINPHHFSSQKKPPVKKTAEGAPANPPPPKPVRACDVKATTVV